jgi:hypothetical protein
MSFVSMAQAAKLFDVSRPTLAKDRAKGKINGEKVDGAWQFDMAELKRVYQRRGDKSSTELHEPLTVQLQTEIRVLQAKLEAAEKLAEAQAKHIDDLRHRLPPPEASPARRWWWQRNPR